MPATIKVPTVFTADDKFSAVVARMTKGITKFGSKSVAAVQRFDTRINNSIKGMSKFSQVLGGLSIGFLAKKSFDDITNYETGLIGVAKTTGLADKEVKKLGKEILTASNNLDSVSAIKLLELAQSAGQLGVKGSDNILKFSTTLAKLEDASDIRGEEGASSIARLLTITGEGVGVVDQFASAIVALGNDSAATESEILGVSSEVARATAAYKLNSREILGISTTLKSLDVRPEAAGTAVGKVFRAIEMSTIKGGKTLRDFGKIMELTPKQVKETFQDSPQKAFEMFIKGLDKVGKSGGSISKVLNDLGLSGETVSKGIIPLATNYDLLDEKLKLASKGFEENTALSEEFDAASKTIKTALASISNGFSNYITKEATEGSGLDLLQKLLFKVGDNMNIVVNTLGILLGLFGLMKVIVLGSQLAMWYYNVSLGVSAALNGKLTKAIVKNEVALGAYKVVTWIATGAQWALNAAMSANPIGLVIIAIAALIGLVALIINKYDEWGASLTLLLGPLGMIINIIQSFRRNWDMVKKAFSEGGFVEGLKAIGRVLLDAILMPVQQLLEVLSNIPGLGGLAGKGAAFIAELRNNLGVNTGDGEGGEEPLPSTNQKINTEKILRTENSSSLSINIKDKGGNVESVNQEGDDIPVKVSSTTGDF